MSAIVPSFDGVPDGLAAAADRLPRRRRHRHQRIPRRPARQTLAGGRARGRRQDRTRRALATATGAELIRLQCYEGIDEARALYEWNHAKQILAIQATGTRSWDEAKSDIFSDEFLLPRPLLRAISETSRRCC